MGKSFHYILRGLLTLLTGLFLLVMPGLTVQTAVMVIGAMLLSSGLITLFLSNRAIGIKGFVSLQGVFNIGVGLAFLVAPTAMLKIFVVFFGIILLIIGTTQLIGALSRFTWRGWSIIYLLFALTLLTGGFMLIYNPFKSMETIVSFIGILLIFYGLSQLMSVKLKKKSEYFNGSHIEDIPHEEI